MTRFQKTIIVLAVAAIAIITTGIIVISSQLAVAKEQADFERCMAIHGYTPEDGPFDNGLLEATLQCS